MPSSHRRIPGVTIAQGFVQALRVLRPTWHWQGPSGESRLARGDAGLDVKTTSTMMAHRGVVFEVLVLPTTRLSWCMCWIPRRRLGVAVGREQRREEQRSDVKGVDGQADGWVAKPAQSARRQGDHRSR